MTTKPKTTTTKKTKRSSTRAAATTPKAAAKTAAMTPKPTVVSTKSSAPKAAAKTNAPTSDEAQRHEATKKDIVASMVAATGMKKGDARRAMEATMTAVAEALAQGKDLSLPPLGKIKIARMKDTPNGKLVVMRAKLKEPGPKVDKDPLAEAAE